MEQGIVGRFWSSFLLNADGEESCRSSLWHWTCSFVFAVALGRANDNIDGFRGLSGINLVSIDSDLSRFAGDKFSIWRSRI